MQHDAQQSPSARRSDRNLIKFAPKTKQSKSCPRAPYRNDASPSLVPQSSRASTSLGTSHGAGFADPLALVHLAGLGNEPTGESQSPKGAG